MSLKYEPASEPLHISVKKNKVKGFKDLNGLKDFCPPKRFKPRPESGLDYLICSKVDRQRLECEGNPNPKP